MKNYFCFASIALIMAISIFTINVSDLHASDGEGSNIISILPVHNVDVDGDFNKFRAHTWMNKGYSGGINELRINQEFDNNTSLHFDARSIPNENDHDVELLLNKQNLGDMTIHYKMFKKYFDNSGGYYHPYTSAFESNDSNTDLNMDIGHFLFEISPSLGNLHDVTFSYEHHSKDGQKSRLTWAEVSENSVKRNIAPSWQDVDEVVNILSLKGQTTISGFDVKAEQNWETVNVNNLRTEKFLSDTSGSGTKMRFQDQEPQSSVLTTTLQGEKWFNDNKSFLAFAYRFNQIEGEETETLRETDENGVAAAYSYDENENNSTSGLSVISNSLVGHYMTNLNPQWNLTAKTKVEMISKDASSALNDITTLDSNFNDTRNKRMNYGQDLGFRYSGLPRSSIYGNVEFGYTTDRLKEDEVDESGSISWFRETWTKVQKTTWTLGSRHIPSKTLNLTTQLRHRRQINDYDDQDESTGVSSAFFEEIETFTNEAKTKLSWKPQNWLRGAVRYQFLHKLFNARHETLLAQQAVTQSHSVSFDIVLQPLDNLLMNLSLSRQDAFTVTAAAADSTVSQAPRFNADVNSLLYSMSYSPKEELSFTGLINYTLSDNFNDFTATALPLAVTNSHYNAEVAMQWAPKDKNWSIKPKYAYYNYKANSISEYGDYNAHVAWLDFNLNW